MQNLSLQEQDPEIFELIQKEKARQVSGIELIASEVRILHFAHAFHLVRDASIAHHGITSLIRVSIWKPSYFYRTSLLALLWSAWAPV